MDRTFFRAGYLSRPHRKIPPSFPSHPLQIFISSLLLFPFILPQLPPSLSTLSLPRVNSLHTFHFSSPPPPSSSPAGDGRASAGRRAAARQWRRGGERAQSWARRRPARRDGAASLLVVASWYTSTAASLRGVGRARRSGGATIFMFFLFLVSLVPCG